NNGCTSGETCQNGSCGSPTSTVTCTALDQCHVAGTRSEERRVGKERNKPKGTACYDKNACTGGETCQNGTCGSPTSTVTCTALDQCHVAGTCHPMSGVCSNPNESNGTACDDNNGCTSGETCQNGACGSPTSTVTCTALDQCHVAGTCDPMSGVCSNPNKANGTACNEDQESTRVKSCHEGTSCGATSTETYTALDQCHVAGTCDPIIGTSSIPIHSNGTARNLHSSPTRRSSDLNGACGSPTSTVTCTALDQCHVAGTCDPMSGVCSNPNKANGTACNEDQESTRVKSCHEGTSCGATSTETYTALDQCHVAGTCDPIIGTSSIPIHSNGTARNLHSSPTRRSSDLNGACGSPTSTVTCTALDQCHVAGTCDPMSGVCSNPNKANGTACNEDQESTRVKSCHEGTSCGATSTETYTALDQCHVAGTCDPIIGTSSIPIHSNGTARNLHSSPTRRSSDLNGACGSPTSTVTCTALDQCHVAGTCDPMSGVCSNPNKANGTACNDNNACTTNDTCSNGACVGGPPPNCDDNNVCTTDSCKPASGCAHMNNTLPCDDANACTFPDTCSGGQCTGVTTAACKVTGGGFIEPLTGEVSGMATLLIERGSDPGGKANFGFVVQLSGGQVVTTAPTGNLTYMDHGANVSVKATSLDSLIITA